MSRCLYTEKIEDRVKDRPRSADGTRLGVEVSHSARRQLYSTATDGIPRCAANGAGASPTTPTLPTAPASPRRCTADAPRPASGSARPGQGATPSLSPAASSSCSLASILLAQEAMRISLLNPDKAEGILLHPTLDCAPWRQGTACELRIVCRLVLPVPALIVLFPGHL